MFKKNPIKITLLVLSSLIVGYLFGGYYTTKTALTTKNGEVKVDKVLNLYSSNRSTSVNFDQYWKIWDKILNKYAGKPDKVDMFYGSLKGMVKALGDPYSKYMPPKSAKEFSKSLSGEFGGIGAEIGMREDTLTVVAPLEKSPAEKAGLKAGDKILAVNGEDTADFSVEEAVSKIRGKKGTQVTLTILHKDAKKPEDITITRGTIDIPTIKWEMKRDKFAYIRIRYFNQNTWPQFEDALKEVKKKSPKGIVLDLRSNPGGYLKTSIDIASEWIKDGVIVSEGVDGQINKRFKSKPPHRFLGIPTIVIVDGGTASGSEIVAGALKDHDKATIIGKTTFGKGSVQTLIPFTDGSALKLTVAKWYTPNGNLIDQKGIEPHIKMEELFKKVKNQKGEVEEIKDLGLQKALNLLENKTTTSVNE